MRQTDATLQGQTTIMETASVDWSRAQPAGFDRIVVINDSAMARGGATGLARRAARLFAVRGHRVTFLCGETGGDFADPEGSLVEDGVDLQTMGQSRLMAQNTASAMTSGIWNRETLGFLGRWIEANDTPGTVYHIHGWAQIFSPSAFAALAPVASRTVVHAHDFFLACPNGAYMHYPRREVCSRVPMSARCLSANCDKRSIIHKGWRVVRQAGLRGVFLRHRWGAVAMIHPNLEEPLRRGGLQDQRLQLILNPAEPFTHTRVEAETNTAIAFVGRLNVEKGAVDLARAVAELGLDAVFVGEGPEEENVKAALPSARITGWRARDEIGPELQKARCLVMPSRLPEPFGLAAAEASLSGLPVILPQISLLSSGISDAGLGLSYDGRDPAALRAALQKIVQLETNEVRAMSQRAWSGAAMIAQDETSWVDALETLYSQVLVRSAAEPVK